MEVEASSPIAAMQPFASHSPWSMPSNEFSRPSAASGKSLFGPKLNVGVKLDRTGYFDRETRIESSPTSMLVADLSQNFHIDKTPQVPTPRRSLFPFGLGGGNGRSLATTPPIPSSSPCHESMDMSPLPHKPAFSAILRAIPMSPTENRTRSLCSSPPTATPTPDLPRMDLSRRPGGLGDRKKSSNFTRPSLLRHNRNTSGGVSFKSTSASSSSGFSTPTLFGKSTTASSMKLEDLFGASPPRGKKELGEPLAMMATTPRSKGFTRESGPTNTSLDGSPVAPLNRQKFQRPRGKIRRTLSMFENPEEIMQRGLRRSKGDLDLSPVKSSPGENSILPCFSSKEDTLRRINKSTLCEVMDGQYKDQYDELMVVDCRFEYEYEGGHISGAVNVNSTDALEKMFFQKPRTEKMLIIFHCEFSAHRAPRMALHLRSRDRQLNMQRYPALYYPDVYILEGGYCSFFNQYRVRCEPEQYVQMKDASHLQTCEREMAKLQKRGKLSRTQSFTFGAQHSLDNSPSASFGKRPAGGCSRDSSEGGLLSFSSRHRGDPRRMASY